MASLLTQASPPPVSDPVHVTHFTSDYKWREFHIVELSCARTRVPAQRAYARMPNFNMHIKAY